MDRYYSSTRKSIVPNKTAPYPLRAKREDDRKRISSLLAPLSVDGGKPSSSVITKHLLNTLSDDSNPITHSNIYERSDIVVSAATGHQRGEGRAPHGATVEAVLEDRSRQLSLQSTEVPSKGILGGVRVYIDGYLSGTTDIEMRRIIVQAGGTTPLHPSSATHIVTSRQLNGSKTRRILTTKSRNPARVVKPEWVTDSVRAGRRLQESHYALLTSTGTRNLVDMLKYGGPD